MTVNRRGFTLIELMVVIAIVAVLAAIAMPAYSKYLAKTKAMNAVIAASGIIDQSVALANTKNKFARPDDLGLSGHYIGGCGGCTSPASIGSPEGLSHMYIHDFSTDLCGGTAQGRIGHVELHFDNTLTGSTFAYYFVLTRINGITRVTCISSTASMNIGSCINTNTTPSGYCSET